MTFSVDLNKYDGEQVSGKKKYEIKSTYVIVNAKEGKKGGKTIRYEAGGGG